MFAAALTDDEERRGFRQVQHGREQKPKLRCIKQPLGAAALPPHERGTDSLYSNAHGDQHSSTYTGCNPKTRRGEYSPRGALGILGAKIISC